MHYNYNLTVSVQKPIQLSQFYFCEENSISLIEKLIQSIGKPLGGVTGGSKFSELRLFVFLLFGVKKTLGECVFFLLFTSVRRICFCFCRCCCCCCRCRCWCCCCCWLRFLRGTVAAFLFRFTHCQNCGGSREARAIMSNLNKDISGHGSVCVCVCAGGVLQATGTACVVCV